VVVPVVVWKGARRAAAVRLAVAAAAVRLAVTAAAVRLAVAAASVRLALAAASLRLAVAAASVRVAPREEEPPADFICPITTELMSDPVMAADGHSYERTAIERWLATKSTSPPDDRRGAHAKLPRPQHAAPDDPGVAADAGLNARTHGLVLRCFRCRPFPSWSCAR